MDALRTRDYWEKRYNSEPAEHEFDWFKSYDDLAPWLDEILRFDHRILMLGCGNSVQTLSSIEEILADIVKRLSSELYKRGFKNIQNIDFSENVIHKMSSKYSNLPEMTWKVRTCRNYTTCLYLNSQTDWFKVMDVRDLKLESSSIDVAIDKVDNHSSKNSECIRAPWMRCYVRQGVYGHLPKKLRRTARRRWMK